MTSRPPRAVRVDVMEVEGRLLLAALPVPSVVASPYQPLISGPPPFLEFVGTATPVAPQVTQVVTQQAGTATVMLSDLSYANPLPGSNARSTAPLQVEVKTDPSSPAVGVNVGAVDQTVTFSKGHSLATLHVPILAGAPNPGEVDVTLTATPLNSPTPFDSARSLVLRILTSDASIPPAFIVEQGTPHGIVLTFSKPMNPDAASNVNNYAVRASHTTFHDFGIYFTPLYWSHSSTSTESVPLRAAVYDSATNSVTLIPKRRLSYIASVTVSQGPGSRMPSRPGNPSDAPVGLTDTVGNPINGNTTPGKFSVVVNSGDPQPVMPSLIALSHPSRLPQKLNRHFDLIRR